MAEFGFFLAVGFVLVLKRPTHPIGWLMSAIALLGAFFGTESWTAYQMVTRGHADALGTFGAWGSAWYWYPLLALLFVYLPLLFPDGRLPSPRWRWLAWTIGACTSAIVAVAVRFRRSLGIERQQLKWFVSAAALLPLTLLGDVVPRFAWLSSIAFGLAIVAMPVAIGVAVLRYRLYEIDRIISRTLTYALVTTLLLGVYAAVSVLPTTLFFLRSDLLVAMATAIWRI